MSASNKANIRNGIKKIAWDGIANPYSFPSLYVGDVESVDIPNRTCSITVLSDGVEVQKDNIALMAINDDGLLLIPAIGSQVRVLDSPNDDPCVIQYSKLDKLQLHVGTSTFDVTTDLSQFNGGTNGGLTITPELKKQLDKTNEIVNAIVNALKNWTVVPSDGGAALKAFFTPLVAGKTVGDYSNIEDTKVKH
jgi:hypothetical protein